MRAVGLNRNNELKDATTLRRCVESEDKLRIEIKNIKKRYERLHSLERSSRFALSRTILKKHLKKYTLYHFSQV